VGREGDSGKDCANPVDFVHPKNTKDGIKKTTVSLVTFKAVPQTRTTIPNISLLHNSNYLSNGLRSWKAFNKSPGILIPWAKLSFNKGLLESLKLLPSVGNLKHKEVEESNKKPYNKLSTT
jgi:hypothetical protein